VRSPTSSKKGPPLQLFEGEGPYESELTQRPFKTACRMNEKRKNPGKKEPKKGGLFGVKK